MNKRVLKSIGAVVGGFFTVAFLSIATDAILENTGVFPTFAYQMKYGSPTWVLLTAFIYRSVYAVVGGYVTAALAPANPMKLVKILAVLGTIGGILGIIAGWNLSEKWYPIALAITAYPLVWLGGELRVKK